MGRLGPEDPQVYVLMVVAVWERIGSCHRDHVVVAAVGRQSARLEEEDPHVRLTEIAVSDAEGYANSRQ